MGSVNGGITRRSLRGAAGDEAIFVEIASLISFARNDESVISPVDWPITEPKRFMLK